MNTADITAAIGEMGTALGPDVLMACRSLFDAEQRALAESVSPYATDIAYGDHERHRLDLYRPDGTGPWPILVFVHGGGFLKGDKGGGDAWPNAAVGQLAARRGFLGVVMNYRLAPESIWPSGAEDVAAVVDWLGGNAAQHSGDPDRIFLVGTSAGSVHIAGYLRHRADHAQAICGAVLLSGLYGFTPIDDRDMLYYGPQSDYANRMPLAAVVETSLPVLFACAEYDPPRFQAEFVAMLQARLDRHAILPRSYIASGHNHYSMAMHLGTSDTRLADEIFGFLRSIG